MANYLKTATVSAILTLEEHGWSQRRIAKRLGIHRDTVGMYVHSFGKDPKPVNASTHSIDQDPRKAGPESQCKAFRKVIQDKLRSGLSRRRIYQDLRDEYAFEGSYYSVRKFVKRLISTIFAKSLLEEIIEAENTLQSEIRNLQNRITTKYLTESNKKNSGGSESLNPWLRQLLFQKGTPEELQAIFSNEELSILRKLLASKSRKHRKQAATIILRKKGFSFKAIGRVLSSSRETVAKYWHKYEERGMNAIVTHTKRHRKADIEALREAVFALLHSPPSSHGVNRTTWTMKDLQNVLKSKGSPACTHVIREIIKSAGYKWRKAKVVLTSNDPEYREKLNHIQSILSSLGRNDRFFSIDEFGPFAVKTKGGKRLVAPGEHPHIPQFQTSKGCLIITAALELSGNQVTHFYSKKKDTTEMIKLLKLLLRRYKKCRRLYLSWDAASWHASNMFYEKVEEVNKRTYRKTHCTPIVKLVPLPASAQFLNVIESVFSGMARAVIHNSDYQSVHEAMASIDCYFKERNKHFRKHPKKAGNKIWRKELVPSKFSEGQNCKDPRW